jgi:hypothetical protein
MVVTIAHHPADTLSTLPKLRLRPMSHRRVTLRKLGPGMRRALEFINQNPGCTKREALQGGAPVMSGKEQTTARTAATRPGPVQVEPGYRRAAFYAPPSLEEKIELASHKPLGAYVARWFPTGWRWVSYDGRIGPKMERVFEFEPEPGDRRGDGDHFVRNCKVVPFVVVTLRVVPCPRPAEGGTTRTLAGRGCYFIVWLTAYSACASVNPLPALEVSCWRRLARLNPPSWR